METEIKLALDPALASRLRRHPLLRGIKPVRRQLLSHYFDTPEFDLMRRRVALRVRHVGRVWVQTLKAETRTVGALSTRPEWEARVRGPAPHLGLLPEEARALLDGIDPQRLGVVFSTDFRRTAWLVSMAGTDMELALDEGQVRAIGSSRPLSEIEIELRAGPVEALHELALQLLDSLPMTPEPRSKAQRGYVQAGAQQSAPVKIPAPAVRPDERAGEVWRSALAAALTQFTGNLPGYLEQPEDLEYLHQLRVAARRLRALAGLAPSLGLVRPPWLDELRSLMASLNPARDWDVLLDETLPAAAESLADAPLCAALLAVLDTRSRQARGLAQAALAAATRLVLEIESSLVRPLEVGEDVRAWAGEVLDKRWRILRKGGAAFEHLDESGRHELRLAAKKLRYAADPFVPMAGRRGQTFMTALSGLQDRLGAANDAVVARRLLADVAAERPELAFEAGCLAGAVAALAVRKEHNTEKIGRALKVKPFWQVPSPGG